MASYILKVARGANEAVRDCSIDNRRDRYADAAAQGGFVAA